jgi:predicted DNA-binding transcriptional regulator AlpA
MRDPIEARPIEILTVDELAAILKMSKNQIYEMTRERTRSGAMRDHRLPVLRINGNIRFRRGDVEDWIERLATSGG